MLFTIWLTSRSAATTAILWFSSLCGGQEEEKGNIQCRQYIVTRNLEVAYSASVIMYYEWKMVG